MFTENGKLSFCSSGYMYPHKMQTGNKVIKLSDTQKKINSSLHPAQDQMVTPSS